MTRADNDNVDEVPLFSDRDCPLQTRVALCLLHRDSMTDESIALAMQERGPIWADALVGAKAILRVIRNPSVALTFQGQAATNHELSDGGLLELAWNGMLDAAAADWPADERSSPPDQRPRA